MKRTVTKSWQWFIIAVAMLSGCDGTNHNVRLDHTRKGILSISITQTHFAHPGIKSGVYLRDANGKVIRLLYARSDAGALLENQSDYSAMDGRLYAESLTEGNYYLHRWHSSKILGNKYKGTFSRPIKIHVSAGQVTYAGNLHFKLDVTSLSKRRHRLTGVKVIYQDQSRRDIPLLRGKFKNLASARVRKLKSLQKTNDNVPGR